MEIRETKKGEIFGGKRKVSEGRILDWTGLMKLADDTTVEIMGVLQGGGTGKKKKRRAKSLGASESEGKYSVESSDEEKFVVIDKQQVMKKCSAH